MTMDKMDEMRSGPIDHNEQKKNVVELLKMARIWSDESIQSNGDALDAAFVDVEETDSDIPMYLQQPWKLLQQHVIDMLSQLKVRIRGKIQVCAVMLTIATARRVHLHFESGTYRRLRA